MWAMIEKFRMCCGSMRGSPATGKARTERGPRSKKSRGGRWAHAAAEDRLSYPDGRNRSRGTARSHRLTRTKCRSGFLHRRSAGDREWAERSGHLSRCVSGPLPVVRPSVGTRQPRKSPNDPLDCVAFPAAALAQNRPDFLKPVQVPAGEGFPAHSQEVSLNRPSRIPGIGNGTSGTCDPSGN